MQASEPGEKHVSGRPPALIDHREFRTRVAIEIHRHFVRAVAVTMPLARKRHRIGAALEGGDADSGQLRTRDARLRAPHQVRRRRCWCRRGRTRLQRYVWRQRGDALDRIPERNRKGKVDPRNRPDQQQRDRPDTRSAMQFPHDPLPPASDVNRERLPDSRDAGPPDNEATQAHHRQAGRADAVEHIAALTGEEVEVQLLQLLDPAVARQLAEDATAHRIEKHSPQLIVLREIGEERPATLIRIVDTAEAISVETALERSQSRRPHPPAARPAVAARRTADRCASGDRREKRARHRSGR